MRRQQALERLVVKRLGDPGPLALLRPEDLLDQRRPLAAKLLDLRLQLLDLATEAPQLLVLPLGAGH